MKQSTCTSPVIYQINVTDLKEVIGQIVREERARILQEERAKKETATIGRKEACRLLGVSPSTLWKWGKWGYLVPVKVGAKVLYRHSDVTALLHKSEKGGCHE